MTYLKKRIGTKFVNTKQCPAGLSPRIIPNCPPKTFMGNVLIYPTRKFPIMKFTSSAIKSVIPSPWNSNFHLVTLYKLHLWLYPWLLSHFLTSIFMYTCVVLILINRCLLNVIFSMTKALDDQSSFKQNLFSVPFNSTRKTLPLHVLVFFFFFHSLFYFKLYEISPDSTPVGTSWLVS